VACLALNVHWARGQEPPPAAVRGLDARNFVQYGDAPGVTVELGGASVLHRTRVEYPEAARNSGIEGTVAVEVTLDTNGNVTDAHVVSGPMELRKAVMSSVFEWHFTQDAAGSARIVNVTFQKGVTDASVRAAAQEQSRMEQEYMSRVQANLERNAGPPPVAVEVIQPRTLAGLEVVGLTGAAKADLLARLPVHAGDALSESSLRAAQEVVRKLDEHLVWQTTQQPDGATFIRIEADPERQNELNGRLLRELAAQQQALGQPQTAEQRWQQEMLRREAVQLYRQMSQAEAGSAQVQESQKLELQARLQAMFGSQEGAAKPQGMEDIQKLRALLDSLQKQIAGSAGSKEAEAKLTSRTVARIEVVGLSDAAKSDLLARLPVHAGDTLSEASLRGVGEAVRKFDEHLVWRATLQPDGTIWIHIETPGAPVTVGK
jgi:TonB family protein